MFSSLMGGALLDLNGLAGLAGWQWVFIATGVPAIIMTGHAAGAAQQPGDGEVPLRPGPRPPGSTRWRRTGRSARPRFGSPWRMLWDRNVLIYSVLYILILTSLYGVIYWLPTVVRGFGVTGTQNGLLSSLPWAITAVMLLWLPARLKQHDSVLGDDGADFAGGGDRLRLQHDAVGDVDALRGACGWARPACRCCCLASGPCPIACSGGAYAATAIAAISMVRAISADSLSQNLMPWGGR